MPTLGHDFSGIHSALIERFGRYASDVQGLDTPFEAMVAALLGRNLGRMSWKSAFDGLEQAGLLEPDRLANAELIQIADTLRVKSKGASLKALAALRPLARWFAAKGDLGDSTMSQIREELAGLKGIGVAAADAILLYALRRPSYPVDRASFRIMVRHGWIDVGASYDDARDVLTSAATSASEQRDLDEVSLLSDVASALEQVGRSHCRAAAPLCDGCPLERYLPDGGPCEAND